MNIKKEVYEKITMRLNDELWGINNEIRKNKNKINEAVKEQTLLKRQRKPLTDLIWLLKNKAVK